MMNHKRIAIFGLLICLILLLLIVQGQSAQKLSIVIETDSWAYGMGDDVTITVTLTNPKDAVITGDLNMAVDILWLDSPAWTSVFTAQPKPFSLPAHGEVQETYKLAMDQYHDSGLFRIVASAGGVVEYGGFTVPAGYDLRLQVPDSVDVGEEFEAALEVKNTLTRAINNIEVDVLFPTGCSLEAHSEHLVIPSLAPGETHLQTWKMSVERGGFNNLIAVVTSKDGGSNKVVASMGVLSEPEIIPTVEDVKEVALGSRFTLKGEVHNVGGQTGEGVQATLSLPSGLATTESLTINVGDIHGGESKVVSWTVQALSAGRYALDLRATDRAGHEGTGVGFVSIASTEKKDDNGLTVSVSDTTGAKGDTVEVPVLLKGASDVGSMDIVLKYDPDVIRAVAVEAGELGKNAFIEANTAREGGVIIALADSSGINGDGAVAIVSFEVTSAVGSTSPLTLEEVSVNNIELVEVITTTESGTFRVTEEGAPIGDASAVILVMAALIIALLIIRRRK